MTEHHDPDTSSAAAPPAGLHPSDPTSDAAPPAGGAPPEPGADRRRFLHSGLAAAAGAAAGAVLACGGVAEAANGDPVKVGQTTSGTNPTIVDGSRLQVNVATNTTTAITGSSNGNDGYGVLGLAGPSGLAIGVKGQGKTGVYGDGNYPNGTGVEGYGPTGVKGQSPANNGVGVTGVATGIGSTGVSGTSPSTGVYGEGELNGVAAFSNTGDALNAHTDGTAKRAVVAEATGNGGTAVFGTATGTGSTGVAGLSPSTGVYGEGELNGVAAFSNTGDALNAHTDGTAKRAIVAEAGGPGGVGVDISAPTGPALRLQPGPAMPPTTGTWTAGDIVMSSGLWLCLVGGVGTASTWTKLSRTYQPLAAPVRIYDSRPTDPPLGVTKGKMTSGQERVIDATVGGAVPAGVASAVEVNVTVVDTDATGWLALFANGVPWPGTSTINWFQVGSVVANGTTVAVDSLARFVIRAAGSTNVVVDVTGWYT